MELRATDEFNRLREYFSIYNDSRRHPIVQDNDDWEEMSAGLVPLESLFNLIYVAKDDDADAIWKTLMRAMLEVAYVKGYERGRDETTFQSLG